MQFCYGIPNQLRFVNKINRNMDTTDQKQQGTNPSKYFNI